MDKCQVCGVAVADGYKFCVKCNTENRKVFSQDKQNDLMQKMNWNLGRIALSIEAILFIQTKNEALAMENLKKLAKIKDEIKKNE